MMRNLKESIVDMYGLMLASVISFTINLASGGGMVEILIKIKDNTYL
jgi:hypothetical protein